MAAQVRGSRCVFKSRRRRNLLYFPAILLLVTVWASKDWAVYGAEGGGGTNCDHWIISEQSRNGTFSSPNYPDPYPENAYCNYHFMGQTNERVQILFTDFDLYHPPDAPKDCEGVDAVMVFIDIDDHKERVDNFCGTTLPAQLMSSGPNMTIEFRSFHSSKDVKGFRGIFRFVTNFGITAGRQHANKGCNFVINSTELSNGTFTSPNWPGYYPRATECHYLFFGRNNERVHITFAYFDIDGIPPCTRETASDYVEFSNFRTVDRKIPRHCGIRVPKVIESDGDFFQVIFKSNDKFDGTGFEAFYQFRNFVDPFTVKRVSVASTGSQDIIFVAHMIFLSVLNIFGITCLFLTKHY